jgi:hypothetical protein
MRAAKRKSGAARTGEIVVQQTLKVRCGDTTRVSAKVLGEDRMSARQLLPFLALSLGLFPICAYAQYVPPLLVVAALTPILVLLLCVVLGILTRSVRVGALHAAYVLAWVLLFILASYFIENDYVIWTPLVLYLLHSALLLVLIVVQIGRRIARSDISR